MTALERLRQAVVNTTSGLQKQAGFKKTLGAVLATALQHPFITGGATLGVLEATGRHLANKGIEKAQENMKQLPTDLLKDLKLWSVVNTFPELVNAKKGPIALNYNIKDPAWKNNAYYNFLLHNAAISPELAGKYGVSAHEIGHAIDFAKHEKGGGTEGLIKYFMDSKRNPWDLVALEDNASNEGRDLLLNGKLRGKPLFKVTKEQAHALTHAGLPSYKGVAWYKTLAPSGWLVKKLERAQANNIEEVIRRVLKDPQYTGKAKSKLNNAIISALAKDFVVQNKY